MRRETIVQHVVAFTLLHGLYQLLLFFHPDIAGQTNTISYIILLLILIWFSKSLWRDTTPEFESYMDSKNMRNFTGILSAVVWLMMGFKLYQDFYGTAVYEQNMLLINGMMLLCVASIDIWFRVAYTRIIFLYVQLNEMRKD